MININDSKFPIENVHNWFFYKLGSTRLPNWFVEFSSHDEILLQITKILVRQERFNEYTKNDIDSLWLECKSIQEYVKALEESLNLDLAEILEKINDLKDVDDAQDLEISNINTEIINVKNDINNINTDIEVISSINTEISNINDNISTISNEISIINSDVEAIENKDETQDASINSLDSRVSDLETGLPPGFTGTVVLTDLNTAPAVGETDKVYIFNDKKFIFVDFMKTSNFPSIPAITQVVAGGIIAGATWNPDIDITDAGRYVQFINYDYVNFSTYTMSMNFKGETVFDYNSSSFKPVIEVYYVWGPQTGLINAVFTPSYSTNVRVWLGDCTSFKKNEPFKTVKRNDVTLERVNETSILNFNIPDIALGGNSMTDVRVKYTIF